MNARRFILVHLFVSLLLVALTMVGSSALAAPPNNGQGPGGHLKIDNVFVDFNSELMIILGESFNFGSPLQVTLGAPGNVGNITSLCTPNFASVPQMITCNFSATGLPPAGDYLLIVSTGNGQSQSDEYDLTIGAVGPQGPQGDKGDEGDQGPIGPQGPQGPTGPQGPVGPTGPQGPQGPAGNLGLAGQQCPSGESVIGFDASGNIVCSGAPPAGCSNLTFTFSLDSSVAGAFSNASWPGGSATQTDPSNSACSVTVARPSGDVVLVGTLGDAWAVSSFAGYSNCFGTGGVNGDGVQNPDCSGLNDPSFPNVTAGRPSCSNGLCSGSFFGCTSGQATDQYVVQCLP